MMNLPIGPSNIAALMTLVLPFWSFYTLSMDQRKEDIKLCDMFRWTSIELDFAYRFDNLGKAAAFFNTYHCIASFIIISLLTALIWEIFSFINKNNEEATNIRNILENIDTTIKKLQTKAAAQAKSRTSLDEIKKFPGVTSSFKQDTSIQINLNDQAILTEGNSRKRSLIEDYQTPKNNRTGETPTHRRQETPNKIKNLLLTIGDDEMKPIVEEDHSRSVIDVPQEGKGKFDLHQDSEKLKTPSFAEHVFFRGSSITKERSKSNYLNLRVEVSSDVNSPEAKKNLRLHSEFSFNPNLDTSNPLITHASSRQLLTTPLASANENPNGYFKSIVTPGFNTQRLANSAKIEDKDAIIPRLGGDEDRISRRPTIVLGQAKTLKNTPIMIEESEMSIDIALLQGETYEDREYFMTEKEFYKKKITLCTTFSLKRNQLDYILDKNLHKRYENDIIYLRLDDKEDNEEEKLEAELLNGHDFQTALTIVGITITNPEAYQELQERILTKIQIKHKKYMHCKSLNK